MAGENVEAVRRSIEALNLGQLDSAVVLLAPDAEWRVAEEHPESRICRGREEIRAYFEEYLQPSRALEAVGVTE